MTQSTLDQAAWFKAKLREGYDRLARGDHRGAGDCCRQVLQRKPDLAEGHFLVGLITMDAGEVRTAVEAFGSVTKLDPQHGGAWAQLARLFIRLGQVNRADDALAQAAQHADDNPVVQDTIATVYTQLGDAGSAASWQDKALASQPRNIGFLINRANNHMFAGEFTQARARLNEALSVSPGNANAHWLLSGLEKAQDRAHVEELRGLLSRPQLPTRDEAYLAYGLGKELEDLQDWNAAFDAFARGAAAKRRNLKFNEDADAELFSTLSETYTQRWMRECGPGHDTSAPVFIVGQPRTGTTLIERILTSHSAVHSAGELRQFESACRRLLKGRGDGGQAAVFRAAASLNPREIGSAYMQLTRPMQGELPRFVDKLPLNFRLLPLILAALPNAHVVHVRRSPMDACFASFKQLFAEAYPHSYEQTEMARHHARYYHLMNDWRERFGDRFFDVDYEQVAADPEPHARALIDFLGLDWEPECLLFHEQRASVTTASVVQVREAAHTRSVGRWRRYEAQLQPMQRQLEALGVPPEHGA